MHICSKSHAHACTGLVHIYTIALKSACVCVCVHSKTRIGHNERLIEISEYMKKIAFVVLVFCCVELRAPGFSAKAVTPSSQNFSFYIK